MTEVDYMEPGWPRDASESSHYPHKLCCTQHRRRCTEPAVWRVRKSGRGYVSAGYYCESHVPMDAFDRDTR